MTAFISRLPSDMQQNPLFPFQDIAPWLPPHNLSPSVFQALVVVSTHEPVSPTALAGLLAHSTAAATGTSDRLVHLGLVERRHNPNDRRKLLLSVSRKGQELLEKAKAHLAQCVMERELRGGGQ